MTENVLKHRGFFGSVEFSAEDQCLFGKVLDIDPLIAYSADSVADIAAAFREAVDAYLADCEESGLEPHKPYKGTFNIRIGPDLHRQAAWVARTRGQKLNELVKRAIAYEITREQVPRPSHEVVNAQIQGFIDSGWGAGRLLAADEFLQNPQVAEFRTVIRHGGRHDH